jgi:MoxR-like ATPase
MDEERLVIRQNLKGSYEKVNQVVSVENFARTRSCSRGVHG